MLRMKTCFFRDTGFHPADLKTADPQVHEDQVTTKMQNSTADTQATDKLPNSFYL